MKTITVLALLFFSSLTLLAQDGKITGKVFDGSNGGTLPDAVIKVEGQNKGTASDLDGKFTIDGLLAGEYTLKATYVGYNPQSYKVKVMSGEVASLDLILKPESTVTDTLVIEADRRMNNEASLLLQQQKSDGIKDGISEQQMKRTPDALASDVLKRIIGITIINDKFVNVRGTSERYNNTTLNGIQLPSSDPDKKAFSFDLFPSSLLENIIISKSFTADQPGNYSGGLVQLTTKDFPDKFTLSFQTSTSYNEGTSTKGGFRSYNASQTKWLFFNSGIDDGNRNLPGNFPNTPISGANNYGKTFRNNWEQTSNKAPLNGGFQLSAGTSFKLGENPLGIILGYTYRNGFDIKQIERNEYAGDTTQTLHFKGTSSEYTVNNGGILNLSYKLGDNSKFSFKNTVSISSEDETSYYEGYRKVVFTSDEDRKLYETHFTERKLYSSILQGSHYIKSLANMNVSWKSSYSESRRNEPDMKTAYYRKDLGTDDPYVIPITSIANSNVGRRYYSNLFDINRNFGLDFETDFFRLGKDQPKSKLKFGGLILGSNRDFRARLFEPFRSGPYVDITLPIEQIFAPANIDSTIISYKETTSFSDSYNASENLYAGYLSFDLPYKKFRIVAGLRFEYSEQKLQGFDRSSPVLPIPINVNLKTNDYLPAINITYALSDKINIRGTVSQTVSRPELRELAPFGFVDFVTDGDVSGNPDLKSSLIQNYDFRFEVYPAGGEILSLSLFYKHFNQPIERVIVPTITAAVPSYTYKNATSGAKNYGMEIEARKNLGFLSKTLKYFSVNANFTLINSQVDLEGTQSAGSESKRRMQGQSPYTVNTGLYYDNIDLGTSINLSFNKSGNKISEVGRVGFKDVIEKGRGILDFSATQRFLKNFEAKFTMKNILSQDAEFVQDVKTDASSDTYITKTVRRITTSPTYGLSLGYKF